MLCDPQSVLSLSEPLFLQWPGLGSSLCFLGLKKVQSPGYGCPFPPPPLHGGTRRLSIIVWVTGALGQTGPGLGCSHWRTGPCCS